MSYAVQIDPDDPKSIHAALRTEWLLTNGLGGYAMATALGVNTRRYHGLLVAATRPPVGRVVALHSLIEQLILPRSEGGEDVIELSTQQFAGNDGQIGLHPGGWQRLTEFRVKPPRHASWTWRIGDMIAHRHIHLAHGENALRVRYQFRGLPAGASFRVRPLLALRDFHSLNADAGAEVQCEVALPYRTWSAGDARLRMRSTAGWRDDPQWWRDFAYERDRDRGQEWRERLYAPGFVRVEAARQHEPPWPALELRFGDDRHFDPLREPAVRERPHPSHALHAAAGQFVVRRRLDDAWLSSVIAGYPWFGDWGRDTMIALPGLMLCTGRLEEAHSTLMCFARHLRNGLIPNLFDDYGGAAHYNTVDASLWFVHAVHALRRAAAGRLKPGFPHGAPLVAACRAIVAAYRRGTDFKIRMHDDGLICAGDDTTQLTWMDAARDGVIFTPRHGKAVEINALWHNALMGLSEMTEDDAERAELLALARRTATSFRDAFWWEQRQCLHDCLVPAEHEETGRMPRFTGDGKLRPNQVFAASLPFSPLNAPQQRAVVQFVGERLLTPFGLRTLDRDDPAYLPRYEGSLFQRDAAYHNGTVWPWLIGPYCEAMLRIENFSHESKQRVRGLLQPLFEEMGHVGGGACLGQIAEVYDAEPPHRPSGCPAQAWSVAEVLRVLTLAT